MPTDPVDEPREEALTVLEQLLTAARAYYDAYGNCGLPFNEDDGDSDNRNRGGTDKQLELPFYCPRQELTQRW
jgi:rubredoxin